jgi:hypothetical protein
MNRIAQNMKKTAERNGWISTPEKIKIASAQKKNFNSINSVFHNLTTLAQKLKLSGLTKEAQILEDKIFHYKMAENKLYNLTEGKGEDWIEFAHPDGSPKLFDSRIRIC